MRKFIIIPVLIFFITTGLFGQLPQKGTFDYIKDAFSKRNSDVMELLIAECNLYLVTFWDSPNTDEVLFMLGNIYEDEKRYSAAFLTYLKIKFIFPTSDRRNDAISNLNQIVHNKAERMFSKKRKDIDELISKSMSFTDRNNAFYEYLKFTHDLNIEDIN